MPNPSAPRTESVADAWATLLAAKAPGAPPPAMGAAGAGAAAALLELYAPYLAPPPAGRPAVFGHLGQTLDGRIATPAGESRWITGAADLDHAHRMRALADAVLVGAATVAADDPRLTVRRVPGPGSPPLRVVLDGDRRLGAERALFQDGAAPTLLVCAEDAPPAPAPGQAMVARVARDARGGLDLARVLALLAARGVRRVFVEGGGVTLSRFLAARLLDRLQFVIAPVILGAGRPSLDLPPVATLADALRPRVRHHVLGDDLMVECIFDHG